MFGYFGSILGHLGSHLRVSWGYLGGILGPVVGGGVVKKTVKLLRSMRTLALEGHLRPS